MNARELLTDYWHFSPLSIVIALSLLAFQVFLNRRASAGKQVLFSTGILLMLLTTVSPLAYLGRYYLFSVHMLNHIVLLLVVPPLLLSGLDGGLVLRLKSAPFKKAGDVIFSTPVAWLAGMGAMYFWHIPSVFGAMKNSEVLHGVHIVSLLVLGLIFIWPVYAPVPWKRLGGLQSALYLFIACVGCTILGILITFDPALVYLHGFQGDNAAIWGLLRNTWGIRPAIDQQAGGLIMWVPACMIYLTNIMLILAGFYRQPDESDHLEKT